MTIDVWRVLDWTVQVAFLPIQLAVHVANNQRAVSMVWAIVEITLEMAMALIFTGVSLLVSACLLLDDTWKRASACKTGSCHPRTLEGTGPNDDLPDSETNTRPRTMKPHRKSSCLTTTVRK